jgi:hypothetical protein
LSSSFLSLHSPRSHPSSSSNFLPVLPVLHFILFNSPSSSFITVSHG